MYLKLSSFQNTGDCLCKLHFECIFVEFVGCYMDQETRTLNGKMTISTTMTVDTCRKTCTDLKFMFYGVEVWINQKKTNELEKVQIQKMIID